MQRFVNVTFGTMFSNQIPHSGVPHSAFERVIPHSGIANCGFERLKASNKIAPGQSESASAALGIAVHKTPQPCKGDTISRQTVERACPAIALRIPEGGLVSITQRAVSCFGFSALFVSLR